MTGAWVDRGTYWQRLGDGATSGGGSGGDLAHDWSEDNLPWAYTSTTEFTADWPSGLTIVPIQTGAGTFRQNLNNTINSVAGGGRVVVELGEGTYTLTSFEKANPQSSSSLYSFGYWNPRLQGLLGQGPDKTFVQIAPNSLSAAQIEEMETLSHGDSGSPLQTGFMRLDSSDTSPGKGLLAGITFRGADQGLMNYTGTPLGGASVGSPQPAPFQGVMLYSHTANGSFQVNHCRFQGASRASSASPPFETGAITTGRTYVDMYKTEIDGRLAAEVNPARPKRGGILMFNSQHRGKIEDCWLHDSNLSRYAVNDQGTSSQPCEYVVTRCKIERISTDRNVDPVYGPLVGWVSQPSCVGYEACSADVVITDTILSQDNTHSDGGPPHHLSMTNVSGTPPSGTMQIVGLQPRTPHLPHLDGFLTARIRDTSYWYIDGLSNTFDVRDTPTSPPKAAHVVHTTQAWNSLIATPQSLAAAGITPATHYIVRTN